MLYFFIGCLLGNYFKTELSWDVGDILFFIITWPICIITAVIVDLYESND